MHVHAGILCGLKVLSLSSHLFLTVPETGCSPLSPPACTRLPPVMTHHVGRTGLKLCWLCGLFRVFQFRYVTLTCTDLSLVQRCGWFLQKQQGESIRSIVLSVLHTCACARAWASLPCWRRLSQLCQKQIIGTLWVICVWAGSVCAGFAFNHF